MGATPEPKRSVAWLIAAALFNAVFIGAGIWFVSTSGVRTRIATISQELTELTKQQESRQRELTALSSEVSRAQAQLQQVQAEVKYQQCTATRTKIEAEMLVSQTRCFAELAQQAACVARGEAKKAHNTLFGLVLGVGLSYLTGGTSLALAGGGGAVMGNAQSTGLCQQPSCDPKPETHQAIVLAKYNLRSVPICQPPPGSVPAVTSAGGSAGATQATDDSLTQPSATSAGWGALAQGQDSLAGQVPHAPNPTAWGAPVSNSYPSFDCKKASTQVELMICRSSELGALDFKMARLFADRLAITPNKSLFGTSQAQWRQNRRDKCVSTDCLLLVYRQRVSQLGGTP